MEVLIRDENLKNMAWYHEWRWWETERTHKCFSSIHEVSVLPLCMLTRAGSQKGLLELV